MRPSLRQREDPLPALLRALDGLDSETRDALGRALLRDEHALEGGDWGAQEDGAGCLLSLAAWELGLDRGEELLVRGVDHVRVPALFDAWWADVVAREGDTVRAARSVREVLSAAVAVVRGTVDEDEAPCDAARVATASR